MMFSCCIDENKVKIFKVEFGYVSTGTIVKKTVRILNDSCKKQYYEVHRMHHPLTNPLYYVFELECYNWILLPGGSIEVKIKYHPVVPFHSNSDYFDITDSNDLCYKICVHGTCIGPNVVPSVSRLLMICPEEVRKVKKRLQLKNYSEVAAIFMFDIDETHCPFKLDVTKGTINPNDHIYVTITFSPLQQGPYAFYLSCLIHDQGPIITELYGYQGFPLSNADEFTPLIFTESKPLVRDFEGYMNDVFRVLRDSYPPISLSANYLDFGQAEFKAKKEFQNFSQSISLTNNTNMDITVKWDKDSENIFNIKPRSAIIQQQKSSLFEVYFCPNKENALFSRELLAYAFWDMKVTESSSVTSGSSVPIPLLVSIRMIGQSFSPESSGWIPQYEVPQVVILPPCLPRLPVYTTFLIKLHGHLPMTFRFLPPKTTHFTLKPMVGIIYRDYQIITLKLFPEIEDEFAYIERWMIQFNGDSKNEVSIEFKGYAEYPKLEIGNNNMVEFISVHPQCEQVTQVTIRNISQHCIRYSFLDLPPEISMKSISSMIIGANEILTQDWIFSPKEIGDYRYLINCCIHALKAGIPLGTSVNIPLEVIGRAEHGYLVALPEELNFGIIAYGQMKKLSFYIFNFSSVKIHYKLICKQHGSLVSDAMPNVEIQPVMETICPRGKQKIDVCITPRKPVFHQLTIQYMLQANSMKKNPLLVVKSRNICVINCMCILSGFEIKDLLYFSVQEHISKVSLWNLLEIDKFNATTKSMIPNDEKVINLRFPEFILSEEPLVIKLLVVNSSSTESAWTLTRVKKCDCKQVIKVRSLTFKYKEYDCNHRLVCTIFPNKGILQPQEQVIIMIKICYIVLGKTSLQWQLKLSNNRVILINADVISLSDLEVRPSLLTNQVLSLEKIYIGDMDAMNQMFWMYNSLDHEVTYCLDISSLQQINIADLCETFLCKNPCGVLPEKSYYPIIFKFQPRRFESYQVNLPFKLGDTWTNLSIIAEADILQKRRFLSGKIPLVDQFSIPELPVYFSTDHIIVSSIPMHSKVNRMITIFNESKNEVIGYQWKQYSMPNVLEIKVVPSSGRIQPTKAHSFCITIKSCSQPCKITANLCCQFIDLSARRAYKKSIVMYNSLCAELKDQFTITATGVDEPKPWLKCLDETKPFYKSLSISCYIYSLLDTDLKTTLDEQFKSAPPPEIRISKNENCARIDSKLINITTFILEGMIWDILNSNMFINTMKENLTKKRNIKYNQYTMSTSERRKLRSRSYNIPPKQLIESIFEQMIFGIVHEEFGLSLCHFNSPEDIRQFHYQKRDPRLPQYNKICSLNQLETKNTIKVEPKEFYMESQVKFNIDDDDSSRGSWN